MGVVDKLANMPPLGKVALFLVITAIIIVLILAATGKLSSKAAATPTVNKDTPTGPVPPFEIIKVVYFLPANGEASGTDVTAEMIARTNLTTGVIPITNTSIFTGASWLTKVDPAPFKVKKYKVYYKKDGVSKVIEFDENMEVSKRKDIQL